MQMTGRRIGTYRHYKTEDVGVHCTMYVRATQFFLIQEVLDTSSSFRQRCVYYTVDSQHHVGLLIINIMNLYPASYARPNLSTKLGITFSFPLRLFIYM